MVPTKKLIFRVKSTWIMISNLKKKFPEVCASDEHCEFGKFLFTLAFITIIRCSLGIGFPSPAYAAFTTTVSKTKDR